ncbi:glycoside hydrolase family 2 TIM barrel-domain containing protein [Falsirhodobacter sp. alg1]|uniref:glycoside hydrolase family 2 protein n=1 Tax=Falsirhodobacter sp. alg1 TaxID=1472418 RepID=UPI0005EEA0B1|nr:glycoside hydrolase family 2 TIM barrel-domain containing protein [Falsirhodobacter sp. alg1]
MRNNQKLNTEWSFRDGFDPDWIKADLGGVAVTLPHNAVDLPLNYFDETAYQHAFTYQRDLHWCAEWEGAEVELRFDAAMADAVVWCNGTEVIRHADGYTPFTARLTPHLTRGANRITVRIDGTENPQIPPFGGRIDYLTYAGIYRDVWLRVLPKAHIRNVKIETPEVLAARKTVVLNLWTEGAQGTATAVIFDASGTEVGRGTAEIADDRAKVTIADLTGITLWSCDTPAMYTADITLQSGDRTLTRFGFRQVDWTPEGFKLNGEALKLRGLNRHQSFPYSGYAQGKRAQERDAEILRFDLGCNIARTSHYPQSTYFLDRCDDIGLLVFEEIPGWQHIGGAAWQDESVQNVARMIERDWNHPSIIIWGVRINESFDNRDFYLRTNATARELDSTRPTGGVRYITESELLEDVYTMNDFVLGEFEIPGTNRPRTALRTQPEVTGLPHPVPYLITEYNGHMFPTKAGDPEAHQSEHAIRHLEVLNAAYADPSISGCIGWCMYDYNTHKDFGAGDRICHHGVMTIFREPKFAAYAYSSQKPASEGIVMEPVTVWARGERNIGGVLPLVILTNCDEVELVFADVVKRVGPDRERFGHLPNPPIIIDDRHFSADELGHWGQSWHGGRITGYLDGEKVAERIFPGDSTPTTLEIVPDVWTAEADASEDIRVIFRALDQAGNKMLFLNDPLTLHVEGPATLIGPEMTVLAGGTSGAWLRLTGEVGTITLTVTSPRFGSHKITLDITEPGPQENLVTFAI